MPYTVTQRIKAVQQPANGYLPVSTFAVKHYNDNRQLYRKENVAPNYVGLAVDYLTHFYVTGNIKEAFDISILGAKILRYEYCKKIEYEMSLQLLERIRQGDITAALQMVTYDDVYRAGKTNLPTLYPDTSTVENIKIMVNRGVRFLKHCSKELYTGLDFGGGYTDIVVNGDCDYVTDNALIDFKVIRGDITADHTLQILMYYLMGLRCWNKKFFQDVKWLALFNPRKNIVYYLKVAEISSNVIQDVSKKVIGYNNSPQKNDNIGKIMEIHSGRWLCGL